MRILALSALTVVSVALASGEPRSLGASGVELRGTLELPPGPGPFPVALIVAGSGPTDRDGNSAVLPGKNDSLKLLAEGLAAQGVASLRYDKRGVGESQGGQQEQDLSVDDFVNDATAWLRALKQEGRFASVSVVGHSEGALIALLAAQREKVAGVVTLAGPGENLASTLRRQLRANPNNPPALLSEADHILNELAAGRRNAAVSPVLQPLFRPSVQPFLISLLRYDPAGELARLKVPALVVQGDRDLQVQVQDARRLAAARRGVQLQIVPGMNHVLKNVGDDLALNQRAYSDSGLPLAPGLVTLVAKFLKSASAP